MGKQAQQRLLASAVGFLVIACGRTTLDDEPTTASTLLAMLPANDEVGQWSQSGTPNVITDEAGLFNQIDGAAPKYIDYGWMESVYATYQQGDETILVAIHDMGTSSNAQALFNYELPPDRTTLSPNSVLDVGGATAYATYSWTGALEVEASISDKTDASKASLLAFTLDVLSK
jgi:hypothetical protein